MERRGGVQSTARGPDRVEYRMKRRVVKMRLEEQSPKPEGPGGPGKGAQSLL